MNRISIWIIRVVFLVSIWCGVYMIVGGIEHVFPSGARIGDGSMPSWVFDEVRIAWGASLLGVAAIVSRLENRSKSGKQ